MKRNISIFGILLLGILCILGAVLVSYKSISLQFFGEQALGEIQHITQNETQICGKYGCTFYDLLNIKYTGIDSKTYISNISVNSDNDQFKAGNKINIWYAKNNPQLVSFDKGGSETLMGVILFVLALVSFFFSFLLSKKNKAYWVE